MIVLIQIFHNETLVETMPFFNYRSIDKTYKMANDWIEKIKKALPDKVLRTETMICDGKGKKHIDKLGGVCRMNKGQITSIRCDILKDNDKVE